MTSYLHGAKARARRRIPGVQEDGEGSALELRNCDVCGITLAIEVGLEDPTLRLLPARGGWDGEACGLFEGHEEVCAPTMRSVA